MNKHFMWIFWPHAEDDVLHENIFEYSTAEPYDVVVISCVLEPYAAEFRQLLLQHAYELIKPGGKVIVVIATVTAEERCD
eukprot:2418858-Amphidinium_carterae.1